MIKVAIAGNIASGKSEVQNILETLNYKVLDTDKTAHDLLKLYSDKIKYLFKDYNISDESGSISREKLGKLIFSNESLKQRLEEFLHPLIKEEICKFFTDNINEKMIFIGIPLVYEANMQDLFDKILFIYTDDDIRKERLIQRNNYTEEYAKIRISSQQPQEEKVKLADYVIYNNKTVRDLKESVINLLSKLGK